MTRGMRAGLSPWDSSHAHRQNASAVRRTPRCGAAPGMRGARAESVAGRVQGARLLSARETSGADEGIRGLEPQKVCLGANLRCASARQRVRAAVAQRQSAATGINPPVLSSRGLAVGTELGEVPSAALALGRKTVSFSATVWRVRIALACGTSRAQRAAGAARPRPVICCR